MRARRLALAVKSQTRLILVAALDDLSVMRMSLSSSLAWGCGARPQPRSSRMPAADTRAAGGTVSWLTMPASTLMHSSACPRASDRKSAAIFFRGNGLRGGPTPSRWRRHRARIRIQRGDNHANNIAQKARASRRKMRGLRFVQIATPALRSYTSRQHPPDAPAAGGWMRWTGCPGSAVP